MTGDHSLPPDPDQPPADEPTAEAPARPVTGSVGRYGGAVVTDRPGRRGAEGLEGLGILVPAPALDDDDPDAPDAVRFGVSSNQPDRADADAHPPIALPPPRDGMAAPAPTSGPGTSFATSPSKVFEGLDAQAAADVGRRRAGGAGKYLLRHMIGRGGFGEVWEAVQTSLWRVIAVKRLRHDLLPDFGGASTRTGQDNELSFWQEAMVTASLDHPNILPVYDLGVDQMGRPLLAMKRIRGRSWFEMMAEDWPVLSSMEFVNKHVAVLASVGQAVAFAHSRGIVHRDIKPSQVMVGEFGETLLTDWGIALVYDPVRAGHTAPLLMESGLARLREGAASPAGTSTYMAPEQTELTADRVGPWTDVYLLGACLYFTLTGTAPHDWAGLGAPAFERAAGGEIQPPDERAPTRDVPPELRALALHALRPAPADRVPTATAFVEALQAYSTGAGKRRESEAMALTVEARLDESARASAETGYRGYSEAHAELVRALALWPDNAHAREVRQRVLREYAEEALAHGDLVLARAQAERIDPDEPCHEPLLDRIAARESRARLHARQRQAAMVACAALVVVLSGLALVARRSAREALAASTAADRYRREAVATARHATEGEDRAQAEQYVSTIRFAQAAIREGRQPVAEKALLAPPARLRGWEWGHLMAQCHGELLTFGGHDGAVSDAAFSPDGLRAATASADGTAAVWDTVTGTRVATMGHAGSPKLRSIEFDASGTRVVTAAETGAGEKSAQATVWETETGRVLATLSGHSGTILGARFSPDGGRVLTFGFDRTARVWDARSGKELARLAHAGYVMDARWDPAGGRVATGGADSSLRVWNMAVASDATAPGTTASPRTPDFTVEIRPEAPAGAGAIAAGRAAPEGDTWVRRVAFSPDGTQLLAGLGNGTVRVLETSGGLETARLRPMVPSPVWDAVWSPDGRRVAAAFRDRAVALWSMPSGRLSATLSAHRGQVTALRFSPGTGKRLATVSKDGTLRLWDTETARELATLPGATDELNSVAFSPDARYLLAGGGDGAARLWSSTAPRRPERDVLAGHGDTVTDAVFVTLPSDPRRPMVATAANDGTARLWNTVDGTPEPPIALQDGKVYSIDAAPDSPSIAATGADGFIRLRTLPGGARLADMAPIPAIMPPAVAGLWSAVFRPDGRAMLVAPVDGPPRVVEIPSGREIQRFVAPGHVARDARFSPDGRIVATAGGDNRIILWDTATSAPLRTLAGHTDRVQSVRFSPDGRRLVSAGLDRLAMVWSTSTGQRELVLAGHTDQLRRAAFGPDGSRILTAGKDQSVKVWDAAGGRELLTLAGHTGIVWTASFSPDGQTVLSGGEDGTARIWEAMPWDAAFLPDNDRSGWPDRLSAWQRARVARWRTTEFHQFLPAGYAAVRRRDLCGLAEGGPDLLRSLTVLASALDDGLAGEDSATSGARRAVAWAAWRLAAALPPPPRALARAHAMGTLLPLARCARAAGETTIAARLALEAYRHAVEPWFMRRLPLHDAAVILDELALSVPDTGAAAALRRRAVAAAWLAIPRTEDRGDDDLGLAPAVFIARVEQRLTALGGALPARPDNRMVFGGNSTATGWLPGWLEYSAYENASPETRDRFQDRINTDNRAYLDSAAPLPDMARLMAVSTDGSSGEIAVPSAAPTRMSDVLREVEAIDPRTSRR